MFVNLLHDIAKLALPLVTYITMFNSGTQRKYWTLSMDEVLQRRKQAHDSYEENYSGPHGDNFNFLTLDEEEAVLSFYGNAILDLCGKFRPPAPACVYGTSLHYFKRFFLSTSVMDYHPRDIMYTCIFFATKVEEYNVSFSQFLSQIAPNYNELGEFVLSTEMPLMQKLNYHLTVHNPYRAYEGFMMDIKVRVPEIQEPEKYRGNAEKFITRSLLTYVPLVYSPSLIALAAIKSVFGQYIEHYITNILGGNDKGQRLLNNVDKIISLVAAFVLPRKQDVVGIEKKLAICRNNENNPLSEHYREVELLEQERKEDEKAARYELSKQKQNMALEELGYKLLE